MTLKTLVNWWMHLKIRKIRSEMKGAWEEGQAFVSCFRIDDGPYDLV